MVCIFGRPFFLIALAVIGYLYASRLTSRYRINPLNASVTKGIFSQSTQTAPLNRVTNSELRRPFAKRFLVLADLMIDTLSDRNTDDRDGAWRCKAI
jgi:uncharacterized membrane protein YdbT with pleckstrin-like domain